MIIIEARGRAIVAGPGSPRPTPFPRQQLNVLALPTRKHGLVAWRQGSIAFYPTMTVDGRSTKYWAEHRSETSEDIQEGRRAGARYQVETPHVQSVCLPALSTHERGDKGYRK